MKKTLRFGQRRLDSCVILGIHNILGLSTTMNNRAFFFIFLSVCSINANGARSRLVYVLSCVCS